jgi:hypothetical protein
MGRKGQKLSEATKQKMSLAKKGTTNNPNGAPRRFPEGETWRERYPDKYKAQRNKDERRRIEKKYGITEEEYRRLQAQATHCPLCGLELKSGSAVTDKQTKVLDHCHNTGKIRGFMCKKCNWGLGLFNDNPELLEKAAQWIRIHQDKE